jgi:hypothetical protein
VRCIIEKEMGGKLENALSTSITHLKMEVA